MNALIVVMAAASASQGIDPAWIAMIGAVFGGAGLKVIEAWLGKSKVKIDDATQIRDELRKQIADLKEENRLLETDIIKWREEYYTLRDQHLKLQVELLKQVDTIKHQVEAQAEKVAPPDPLTDEPKE